MSSELACLRLAVLLYLAATVAALLAIAVRRETPRALMPRLLGVGLVVHTAALGLRSAHAGHPAVTTFDEALSFLALLLVAIFLVVQFRRPLVALGAVVSPLAFSASLLYLVQERRLKARRGPGLLRHLPSLETLDRLNYACLVWGLILLTLGMVSGIIWAHTAWGRFWSSDPKVLFSFLTWGIYVVLLQGRMIAGWRGRWAATLTIAGFAVLVLSLVGVNVLALGNHGKAF